MTKDESERMVRALCKRWLDVTGQRGEDPIMLSFSEFYAWLELDHRVCLRFATRRSVREDVSLWFHDEVGSLWTQ